MENSLAPREHGAPLHVREYTAADLPMVTAWWRAHSELDFSPALLPPLGVIVESAGAPVAALWLYMAVNVGVCFAEFAIARPGLSLRQSREAFAAALGALEAAAKANDYGIMICHTSPGIARIMRGLGFRIDPRPTTSVAKLL